MPTKVWYRDYENNSQVVANLSARYWDRIKSFKANPHTALEEIKRDIWARVVHESNWQEGIEIDLHRTRELADAVFHDGLPQQGVHIDLRSYMDAHRAIVIKLKRGKHSAEEIATLNLARSARICDIITSYSLSCKISLQLKTLADIKTSASKLNTQASVELISRSGQLLENQLSGRESTIIQFKHPIATQGQLCRELMELPDNELKNCVRIEHIHALHKTIFMGLRPNSRCGAFRRGSVHVGNLNLFFPPASVVPAMMQELCNEVSAMLQQPVDRDDILDAARISHRLVAIHPYSDGNGRISRLLMNLVLGHHHPDVYLKADKKGRHRYIQALRRADRGNFEALASLIALALIDIYSRMLSAIDPAFRAMDNP